MNSFDFVIRPRYEETDQMGVIYHGNYYRYFEVGRCEFLRSLGYSYRGLEEKGIILPVIESRCRYIQPVVYDQEIIIRTTIETFKGARINFNYQVIDKASEQLLAEGTTHHAFVDRDLKPLRISRLDPVFVEAVRQATHE
jgi:acyl-CoA thioester hydrolase